MIKHILTVIALLVFNITIAQEKLKVTYEEFINNTYPIQRDEILLIDVTNKTSVYEMNYKTQKEFDSADGQFKLDEVGMSVGRVIDSDYVIFDLKNKKMEMYEDLGRRFYKINDVFPDLKWELVPNEIKTVNEVVCNKAITHFRGRTWEVWYAPSVPLPFGPWKLHGLPGLILEAKDKEEIYYFVARSIEHNSDYTVELPKSTIKKEITFKEYLIIQDNFYNNSIPISPDEVNLSEKHNFVKTEKEKEFEFLVEFSWQE